MSTDFWGNNPLFRTTKEKIDLSTLQGSLISLKNGSFFGGSLSIEFENGTPFNEYSPAALNVKLSQDAADFIYDAVRLDFVPEEQLFATYQYLTKDVVNDPTILVEAAKTTEMIDSPVFFSDLKDVPLELENEIRDIESTTVDGNQDVNAAILNLTNIVEQIYITKEQVDPYILQTLNVDSYQTIQEATLVTAAKEIVPAIIELDNLMRKSGAKPDDLLALGGSIREDVDFSLDEHDRNRIWEVETNARVTAPFINGNDFADVQPNDFIIYSVEEDGYRHLDFGRLINRLGASIVELRNLIATKQDVVDNQLATISKITVNAINELYESVINIEVPTLSFKATIETDTTIANQCSGASKYWVVITESEAPVRVEAKWDNGIYNKELLNGDTILYDRITGHCRVVSDHVIMLRQLEETYQQTVNSLPSKANAVQPTLKTTDKTIVGAINEVLGILASKETIGPSLGLDATVGYYDQTTINIANELDYIYPVQPVMVDALRSFQRANVTFPNETSVEVTDRALILKGTKTSPDLNLVIDPYKNTREVANKITNLKFLEDYVDPTYLSGTLVDGLDVFKQQLDQINDTVYHKHLPVGLPEGKGYLETLTEVHTKVRTKLTARNVPMITPLCDLKALYDLHGEGAVCEYKGNIFIIDKSDPLAVVLKVYATTPYNYKTFTLLASETILSSVTGDIKMTHNGTELVIASCNATQLDGSSAGLIFTVLDLTTLAFVNHPVGTEVVADDANLTTAFCLANGTIHYAFKYTSAGNAKLELGKIGLATRVTERNLRTIGLKYINDVLVAATYHNGQLVVTMNGTGVDNCMGTFTAENLQPISPILKGLTGVIDGEVFAATDNKRTVVGDRSNLWIYTGNNLHSPTAVIPNSLFDGLVPLRACDGIYPMVVMSKSNDATARILCAITEA